MLSARTGFDLEVHPLAEALQQLRAQGREAYDLAESNPTRAGLVYPEAEIHAALSSPGNLLYRPEPAGSATAREAVAELYRERSCRLEIGDLILAPGTSDAYSWLFKLLADPGDTILVPRPSYPLFQYLARMESVRAVSYRLHWIQEWSIDLEELRELAQRHRPRAILLVHPNNPTGSYVRAFEWQRLEEIAAESGAALICDEVFFDFPLAGTEPFDPARRAGAPTFILNGISKLLLLPQLKLAWILLRGSDGFRREARARLELIADTYLSVNTVTQNALPRLLPLRRRLAAQAARRCRENLAAMSALTAGTPVQVLPPEGGWYGVLRVPATRSDVDWAQQILEAAQVLVHPGDFFEFSTTGHLVVGLLTPPEVLAEGIRRLTEVVTAG